MVCSQTQIVVFDYILFPSFTHTTGMTQFLDRLLSYRFRVYAVLVGYKFKIPHSHNCANINFTHNV